MLSYAMSNKAVQQPNVVFQMFTRLFQLCKKILAKNQLTTYQTIDRTKSNQS